MSGELAPYSLSELSLFIVSIITSAGGLCAILGKIMASSRFKEWTCCCVKITNDPYDKAELEIMKDKLEIEAPRKQSNAFNKDSQVP